MYILCYEHFHSCISGTSNIQTHHKIRLITIKIDSKHSLLKVHIMIHFSQTLGNIISISVRHHRAYVTVTFTRSFIKLPLPLCVNIPSKRLWIIRRLVFKSDPLLFSWLLCSDRSTWLVLKSLSFIITISDAFVNRYTKVYFYQRKLNQYNV